MGSEVNGGKWGQGKWGQPPFPRLYELLSRLHQPSFPSSVFASLRSNPASSSVFPSSVFVNLRSSPNFYRPDKIFLDKLFGTDRITNK